MNKIKISSKEFLLLFNTSQAISSVMDIEKILKLITRSACKITGAEASTLRLLDENKENLILVASCGVSLEHSKKGPIRVGESIAGVAMQKKRPQMVIDVIKDPRYLHPEYAKKSGLKSLLSIPLVIKKKSIGVLSIYTKKIHKFSKKEIKLLTFFANQAAISIENARLLQETEAAYMDMIRTLGEIVDSFDWYTERHSQNVRNYARRIAEEIGLSKKEIEEIEYAAYIHDVGKVGININILRKPGPLTKQEWAQVVKHPIYSAEIASKLKPLKKIVPIIRHHHERYDGSGYPDGLKGNAIPLGARIIAIADAYDAMTSVRPYRDALHKKLAIKELKRNSGRQFDPKIVKVFLKILKMVEEL